MSHHPIRALLVLGALSLGIPAGAQSVTSLTLSPTSIRGGDSTTASVTLTAAAPVGGRVVQLSSPSPAMIVAPDTIVVPAGRTQASVRLTVFPVDTGLTSSINGTTIDGATQSAPLTVQSGPATRARIAVFRPETATWYARKDGGATASFQFGASGDVPVPNDYLGYGSAVRSDDATQPAVFRPRGGQWFVSSSTGTVSVNWGAFGDIPAAADYQGLGRVQVAVFRPSTRQWFVRTDLGGIRTDEFGEVNDIPVPGDYFGLGRAQLAVYRPDNRKWYVRKDGGDFEDTEFGEEGDIPVPADYLGLGRLQIAVFRPSTGEWLIRRDGGDFVKIPFTAPGVVPMPADYLGMGRAQIATYRPSTGEWFIRTDGGDPLRIQFGGPGDRAVPSAYSPAVAPVPVVAASVR